MSNKSSLAHCSRLKNLLYLTYHMIVSRDFRTPFIKKVKIAHNTYCFYFDITAAYFDFFPGQYVRITLPIHSFDGLGASRFFTIASSPINKGTISITCQRGRSDFKNALQDLQPGELVDLFGPLGGFYLRENNTTDQIFIAGGIGITPFYSMLSYAAQKAMKQRFTLFACFSSYEELIFHDELTQLATHYSNIDVIYSLSDVQRPPIIWTGEKGRFSERMLKRHVTNILEPIYHIVGSPTMVTETEALLQTIGIPEGQVRIEHFTGY